PLPRDEDRTAHVEPEDAVLERRSVPLAHEETNQPFIALIQLGLVPGEADPRSVHDREVAGHRSVEANEAVVKDANRILSYDSVGRGHLAGESSHPPGGHRRALGSSSEAAVRSDSSRDE